MKLWQKNTFRQAAWAPLLVFVFYAVAAKGFNAYIIYPWLDMPTHFCGGLAITYFYLAATIHAQLRLGRIPGAVQLLLSLGLTAITAVIWEFIEYSSDMLLGTKMNLGVSDTLSDLFFGLLGGFVVVLFYASTSYRNRLRSPENVMASEATLLAGVAVSASFSAANHLTNNGTSF